MMKRLLIITIVVVAIIFNSCAPSPVNPVKTPSITVEPATTNKVVQQTKEDAGDIMTGQEVAKPTMIDDDVEQFKENMQGEYLLLDVRTQGEYDEGHIDDATLIPVDELESRLDEISEYKNLPVLVYCRSGNRSVTASNILLANGFTNVHNLLGGINAWNSNK